MRSSHRWLFIFGSLIGILVIVTVMLVLVTTPRSEEFLLRVDAPEGTVQRFLLAFKNEDYLAAGSYLSSTINDKTDDLQKNQLVKSSESAGWKATLGKSLVRDDEATVEVMVDVFRPRGPFESSVRSSQIAFFLKKEDSAWRIISPVNLWWLY